MHFFKCEFHTLYILKKKMWKEKSVGVKQGIKNKREKNFNKEIKKDGRKEKWKKIGGREKNMNIRSKKEGREKKGGNQKETKKNEKNDGKNL